MLGFSFLLGIEFKSPPWWHTLILQALRSCSTISSLLMLLIMALTSSSSHYTLPFYGVVSLHPALPTTLLVILSWCGSYWLLNNRLFNFTNLYPASLTKVQRAWEELKKSYCLYSSAFQIASQINWICPSSSFLQGYRNMLLIVFNNVSQAQPSKV